jgi:hypothetical protein
LLVGHTDTAGSPGYNDKLSLERADAMAAYLTGDVDAWFAFYGSSIADEKRWGKREDLAMIDALPDAATRDPTEAPVTFFQRTRGLTVDGIAGTETRHALIGEYMALEGTTLDPGVSITTHGCGENFPRDPTGDGVDDPDNRRVEIFLFDAGLGVQPAPPGKNSAKGSPQHPEWVARAGDPVDFSTEDDLLTLELEWATDLLDSLPEGTAVVLTGDGLAPDKHFLALADRGDGVGRISFSGLDPDQVVTITAETDGQQLVLVTDQRAGDLDNPMVWDHRLDELLVPEAASDDGVLVAAGGLPDDADVRDAPAAATANA